jgi:hypothetical protein
VQPNIAVRIGRVSGDRVEAHRHSLACLIDSLEHGADKVS